MLKAALLALLLSSASSTLQAQTAKIRTDAVGLAAEVLVERLDQPWGLDFLPDGAAIVTEKSGRLRIFSDGALSEAIGGMPEVSISGQGGLLDVAADPDFATNSYIYFSFSEPGDGGAGTAVARAKLIREGGAGRLEDVSVIFSMARKTGTRQHFGSRLAFAPDGTLFVTTGDRGDGKRAQDMNDHAGAVIRINADGSIPSDNPYRDTAGILPELWSKGHRNVQGATFDPLTRALITVEHGAKGGDEVNRPEAGKNYGWPTISYGVDYSGAKLGIGSRAEGLEQPLHYWDPSIAPSGLASYRGKMFPEWEGDLLVGSLKFGIISRLDRDDQGKILGEERFLDGEFGRIRDLNVASDGSVWVLTDENDGAIIRLSRAD